MMGSPPGEGPDWEAKSLLLLASRPNFTLTGEIFSFPLFSNVYLWYFFKYRIQLWWPAEVRSFFSVTMDIFHLVDGLTCRHLSPAGPSRSSCRMSLIMVQQHSTWVLIHDRATMQTGNRGCAVVVRRPVFK